MNLYVWTYVNKVTDSYQDEGGVMITAPTLDAARLVAETHIGNRDSDLFTEGPTHVIALAEHAMSPDCVIFPDSGCC